LAWSNQYFGSGASAHHAVVISQELRRALAAAKVRAARSNPSPAEAPLGAAAALIDTTSASYGLWCPTKISLGVDSKWQRVTALDIDA
jgi:hypothetical protein